MGLNYDTAASILLCAEDNNNILCFEDEFEDENAHDSAPMNQRCALYGNLLMGFDLPSHECLDLMMKREVEHLPRSDYVKRLIDGDLDMSIRRDAIDWILKVHAHYNFGPMSAYLSVNYLDRFLSAYELLKGKAWMAQLLFVACLSLAAKMEETEVPLPLDLQVCESKYVFEAKTIQRMELLVLSTLKWRMQAVTPFSYIDYFLHKLNDGHIPTKSSMAQIVELVLSTIRGIEFLEFRPSEIAASVVLSALGETQVVEIEKAMTCCNYVVDKERFMRCYEVIQEVIIMKGGKLKNEITSASFVPENPNGVLEAEFLSYKSDDSSHANDFHCSPASKRRKLSRP